MGKKRTGLAKEKPTGPRRGPKFAERARIIDLHKKAVKDKQQKDKQKRQQGRLKREEREQKEAREQRVAAAVVTASAKTPFRFTPELPWAADLRAAAAAGLDWGRALAFFTQRLPELGCEMSAPIAAGYIVDLLKAKKPSTWATVLPKELPTFVSDPVVVEALVNEFAFIISPRWADSSESFPINDAADTAAPTGLAIARSDAGATTKRKKKKKKTRKIVVQEDG